MSVTERCEVSIRAQAHASKNATGGAVLVAYVAPKYLWYVLPVRVVEQLRSLKLFAGSRKKRSKFERFREA